MYDKYPEYDVPQNNIVQRFFGQRWSAIVIEIVMTIVISVAAGHALDIFGPFDAPTDAAPARHTEASEQPETLPSLAEAVQGEFELPALTAHDECARGECALAHIARGHAMLAQGRLDGALAHLGRAIEIGSEDPAIYLEIAEIYDTLGLPRSAGQIHEEFHEKFGKSGEYVAQLRSSGGKRAD